MPCQARILFLASSPPILFIFPLFFFSFSFFSSNPLVSVPWFVSSLRAVLRLSLANRQSPIDNPGYPVFSLQPFSLSNKTKKTIRSQLVHFLSPRRTPMHCTFNLRMHSTAVLFHLIGSWSSRALF
ncbi:hypothetical protein GGI43DRAFT_237265 [Trichoderma evansii]